MSVGFFLSFLSLWSRPAGFVAASMMNDDSLLRTRKELSHLALTSQSVTCLRTKLETLSFDTLSGTRNLNQFRLKYVVFF